MSGRGRLGMGRRRKRIYPRPELEEQIVSLERAFTEKRKKTIGSVRESPKRTVTIDSTNGF